ncbi:MAG: thioredoxin-disulfide reductase [Bacteroidales bacterium]|nr:thioredoxin-disulfide reductase [Bacteroidales bacterium]
MGLFGSLNLNNNEQKSEKKQKDPSEHIQVLIIGSGPAGYTAGIYAARAGLKPVIYQGMQAGGQLMDTTEVENFPGYPQGITGPVLMEDLQKQAERFGTDIRWGEVTSVDLSKKPYTAVIDEDIVVTADAIIIATGASAKYLGLESEMRLRGGGVSACATCDGFFYREKIVAVVGGGDTAAEEALYLSTLAAKVYLIVRKPEMRASKIMQKRVLNNPKIEVLFEHNTLEVLGDKNVNAVKLVKHQGQDNEEIYDLPIDGFFLAIGHKPNSDIFKEFVNTDEVGYIVTEGKTSKTNVPGVFACGDVQDSSYRQAVTAAGSGCMAALDAERYISETEFNEKE